jgi:hypothetical protein
VPSGTFDQASGGEMFSPMQFGLLCLSLHAFFCRQGAVVLNRRRGQHENFGRSGRRYCREGCDGESDGRQQDFDTALHDVALLGFSESAG